MSNPEITTVIPTYRRPRLLRRALESVLAQTYPDFRVLVFDNASGDETAEVVAEFRDRDPRVAYHCQPENLGIIPNMQYGMDAVETRYFSVLCDDDLLLPGFYEHAIDQLRAYPQARFFCGQAVLYNEAMGTHSIRPRRQWESGLYEAGAATARMMDMFFTMTACVFNSEIRATVDPFEHTNMADVVMLLRAAASFPFVVSLQPCAVIVETGLNTTGQSSCEELSRSYEILKRSCRDLTEITEQERAGTDALIEKHFRVVANTMLQAAIEAGDRDRFDELADFALKRGGLGGRRKLRIVLGRRGGIFPLLQGATRLKTRYRRMRRSGWRRMSLEEVLAEYGGRTATIGTGPHEVHPD